MRTQIVELDRAVGKLLGDAIFHSSGRKLLARGRQLSEDDARLLSAEGLREVPVAILDDEEVPEEEAAMALAAAACTGALQPREAPGGRVNVCAAANCCVVVDDARLRALNRGGAVTAATLPSFTFAWVGQRVATFKTAPFAIPQRQFLDARRELDERGPIVSGRPIANPIVAVLYSDPLRGERARGLFEGVMRTRLERFGASVSFVLSSIETEEALARNLDHLLRARPNVLLIASTTAPAGPADAVGRAMVRAGARVESFLAPVEPGNLLLLAYAGRTPIVSAPGCYRSPKPNVIDLILPPLLAGYPLTSADIAAFGHGGLLH